jgi:hypothetical protein
VIVDRASLRLLMRPSCREKRSDVQGVITRTKSPVDPTSGLGMLRYDAAKLNPGEPLQLFNVISLESLKVID